MAEMRSDNTLYQYNTRDRSGFAPEQLDEFGEIDDNSVVYSFFNTSYNGIARANTLLDNLKGNTSVSDSLNAPIKGQAEAFAPLTILSSSACSAMFPWSCTKSLPLPPPFQTPPVSRPSMSMRPL